MMKFIKHRKLSLPKTLTILMPFLFLFFGHVSAQMPVLDWAKAVLSTNVSQGTINSIQPSRGSFDQNGNFYGIGCFNGVMDFDPGTNPQDTFYLHQGPAGTVSYYLSKNDSLGHLVWARSIHRTTPLTSPNLSISALPVIGRPVLDNEGNLYINIWLEDPDSSRSFVVDYGNGTVDTINLINTQLSTQNYNCYLLKFSNSGQFIWVRPFFYNYYSLAGANLFYVNEGALSGDCLVTDDSDNVYLLQHFKDSVYLGYNGANHKISVPTTFVGKNNAYLFKFNKDGDYQWGKPLSLGGGSDGGFQRIATDQHKHLFLTGAIEADTLKLLNGATIINELDPSGGGFTICEYDLDGNLQWHRSSGTTEHHFDPNYQTEVYVNQGNILRLTVTPVGDIFLGGLFSDSLDLNPGSTGGKLYTNDSSTIFFTKFNSDGQFIWGKSLSIMPDSNGSLGSSNYASANYPMDLFVTPDESVFMTGGFAGTIDMDPGPDTFSLSTDNYRDIFTGKWDEDGNLIWAFSMGINFRNDIGLTVRAIDSNYIYSSGVFNGTVDFDPGSGVYNLSSMAGPSLYIQKLKDYTAPGGGDDGGGGSTNGVGDLSNQIGGMVYLYPNPAEEFLLLDNQSAYSMRYLTVYNLLGQKVLSRKMTDGRKYALQTKSLVPGIYQLALQMSNGVVVYKRFERE